ncbi:MAG: transglutaminase family protein, partial [Acidobacteria bacterium]|nr:transglutaminase family protein [Acidobacteriota bacterium]
MAIRVALHHKTVYNYDRLVTLSPQVVRLRPAPHSRTPIASYSLRIEPEDHFINWQQDPHGNFLARLVFPNQTRRFSLEVSLVAEMTVINPFDFFLEPTAEKYPFRYEPAEERDLKAFLEPLPAEPLLEEFVASIDRREARTQDFLVDLNQRLQREIRYTIRMEPGIRTPEETLQSASGSCRDTGWLLVQVLRRLGLAARFVSGYLIQLKPDVKPLDGAPGPQDDFTDLHAWAEVYLPGAGWIGLDPTSGLLAGEGHIPLAATPEPLSAAPVSGLVSSCEVEFSHEMRVTRIHEDPRVTKPYTDEQWRRMCELGDCIDEKLAAGDVRLTMGGEPTFVSIDDMDGEEWNTAALGPAKLRLAADLLGRLRDRFAPNGMLHFGQGKWYPGESLPRWAFSCYWRADGLPLWRDSRLQADLDRDYGFGAADAERFAEELARGLALPPDCVVTAYEDPLAYILNERQLPVNVDPKDNKLDDAEERERLRRVFERGLGRPTGFVFPLRRGHGKSGPEWQTSLWMLRSRHLFLIPGDSPLGLRLPMKSLPWEPPETIQRVRPIDPMAPIGPMPVPRQGRLGVVLPPVCSAEDFADLVAAIENTAARLDIPVLVEGYPPPFDPRLRYLKVTPDPGVIEVNIHPAASWRELVENTTALYEQAHLSRLGAEKFMIDGRHTGTGGGNHLTLGGPSPSDSPFLRRPDLLKSFIGYWLNHPSLSYLFSGVFVGPTSQAPRVDETRAGAVYELELAFSLIGHPGAGECPPWLVDRIFRNLLVDVTGNTHRAEFCIDKLYSPDSATGRLGLVEMRAFEMP